MQNFEFIRGDIWLEWLFSFYCLLMVVAILYAVKKSGSNVRIFSMIFFGFLFSFAGAVWNGVPLMQPVPEIPIIFASIMIFAGLFAFSGFGKRIGDYFSLAVLIGFQGFRFPLELIIHHWVSTGTVPETMTWTGQNFDIVTGVLSLIASPFLNRSKKLAWVVQIVGFVLLLNVLRVVIMSSPLPFSWQLERPLLLIAYMPYALIGPLFVGVALALHLITFRKLISKHN